MPGREREVNQGRRRTLKLIGGLAAMLTTPSLLTSLTSCQESSRLKLANYSKALDAGVRFDKGPNHPETGMLGVRLVAPCLNELLPGEGNGFYYASGNRENHSAGVHFLLTRGSSREIFQIKTTVGFNDAHDYRNTKQFLLITQETNLLTNHDFSLRWRDWQFEAAFWDNTQLDQRLLTSPAN